MNPGSASFGCEFLQSGKDVYCLTPEEPAPFLEKVIKIGPKPLDLLYFFQQLSC